MVVLEWVETKSVRVGKMIQTSVRRVLDLCESGLDTRSTKLGWILHSSTKMVWTRVVPEWFGH